MEKYNDKFGEKMKLKMEKDLIGKMVIAGVLGVILIICIVVAISLLGGDKADKNPVPVATHNQEEVQEDVADVPVDYERMLSLVKVMNKDEGFMQVYDVEKNLSITLNISSAVSFEDEYGTAIIMEQIIPGYLVNVKYDKATYIPEFVKIAPQVQTIKNLSSLTIDEVLKTIQIASDIYSYDDNIVALDGKGPLVLADLSIVDDIVVRAYQGKIWSIIVENGHGYIVLSNYSSYLEGRLEIGNRTSHTIIEDMKVPVTVGVHTVIITKEEMTPYSSSVFIEENEEYVIDLIDLQPKVAEVIFTIVQDGSTLYIDDETIEDVAVPVNLDYGQYSIRVKKDGYMDWEGILVVDQPYIPQTIDMEIEPLLLHMTAPDGAEFYIDGMLQGVVKGVTPVDVPIIPGGHILTLRKKGYISWSQSVLIEDTGEDYYYTVSKLTEIPKEPIPEPEPENSTEPIPEPNPENPTEPIPEPNPENPITDGEGVDSGAPADDVYSNNN